MVFFIIFVEINNIMETEKEIIDNAQEAFNKMTEANMPFGDKTFVMNAFREQGVSHMKNCVEQDGKFFRHPDVPNFLFSNESEAKFAAALVEFSKDYTTTDKAISNVFPIVLKLLGVDSEWSLDLSK
jgi:predicted metal-binding protein